MKIISLQPDAKALIAQNQNAAIGKKQMNATNVAINFLKGKCPEIVPMLTNPTTRTFLIKFFDMIAADPSVMNGFKNALQTINSAMQSDASGTTASITTST